MYCSFCVKILTCMFMEEIVVFLFMVYNMMYLAV